VLGSYAKNVKGSCRRRGAGVRFQVSGVSGRELTADSRQPPPLGHFRETRMFRQKHLATSGKYRCRQLSTTGKHERVSPVETLSSAARCWWPFHEPFARRRNAGHSGVPHRLSVARLSP
jgi:hypothetical protein